MNKRQWASKLLLAGGVVEILVAIIHFLMPLHFSKVNEVIELSPGYRHFFLLGVNAIGLSVGVFGVLCIYYSTKILRGDASAWAFGLSQGVLWLGRTILELIYPVSIPLFFIDNPTILVLPLSILLTLVFFVPMLMIRGEIGAGKGK